MSPTVRQILPSLLPVLLLMLVSEPAHALRCGQRLVREGMYESQIIALCGEPVSKRYLGYVLRPSVMKLSAGTFGMHSTRQVYSGYHEELLVTELTFNFGPQKLIRILRFEGGQLISIRTAGYGYREKGD